MLKVREGACLRVGDFNNGLRVDKRDLGGRKWMKFERKDAKGEKRGI
jgi:hypothetical protein